MTLVFITDEIIVEVIKFLPVEILKKSSYSILKNMLMGSLFFLVIKKQYCETFAN